MEIADLQMVKTMIAHSQKYFGEDWMWGSPRTGALRWYVPLWDLALTVTNVEKPQGKFHMFGKKFLYGLRYVEYEFAGHDYLVVVNLLLSWKNNKGFNQDPVWAPNPTGKIFEIWPEGDVAAFEDAIAWFKIMKTLDIPQP